MRITGLARGPFVDLMEWFFENKSANASITAEAIGDGEYPSFVVNIRAQIMKIVMDLYNEKVTISLGREPFTMGINDYCAIHLN